MQRTGDAQIRAKAAAKSPPLETPLPEPLINDLDPRKQVTQGMWH